MKNQFVQVIVFVTSLAGYVTLAWQERATAEYVTLVGPVIAALFVVGHLDRRSDQQDQVLGQIQEQTNGVLDKRIEDGVLKALAKREDPGTQ
jgi:hypothetical protein